jgi:protein-glutamine gamma-glutamyltransferase
MYDIRQFRPTLYLLLALGITGFALAAESPGLWLLAMGAMMLNAWLVYSGRFVPLPRFLAAAATIVALIYVIMEFRYSIATIFTVGEFLVLLHLVKLYEQRANRDYAQMLVLSLLLMAAAAISTANLIFGVLLLIYLFVSLYCCLLFHLKVETDAAKALLANALHSSSRLPERVNPASLRQDQRRLSASMRRLTVLVSVVSIFMAVIVFLFFPRGAEGLWNRRFWTPPRASIAGFSEQVTLGQVTSIASSPEIVAQVEVRHLGKWWQGAQPLMLRGTTLDTYIDKGDQVNAGIGWEWEREGDDEEPEEISAKAGETSLPFAPTAADNDGYEQEVTLQPTGTQTLFAIAGPYQLMTGEDWQGLYHPRDAALDSRDSLDTLSAMRYSVWSTGQLPVEPELTPRTPLITNSHIDPLVTAFARQPVVSGTDADGRPLVDLLAQPDHPADTERRIAANIERYLRANFHYTLDLSDAGPQLTGKDPIVSFLYDLKRGHCEYFAGAMTLMCQSLGLHARMVVGFASDEFNPVGHFYIVRRSHVHAWVEVLTDLGWETFDPTASNDAITPSPRGFFAAAKNLFDYLQYEWGAAVVAYGQENRQTIVRVMDVAMTKTVINSDQALWNLPAKFNAMAEAIANPSRIVGLMAIMGCIVVLLVAYYLYDRHRLRRRASRIGLVGLPAAQRQRLVRQLGFYDDLLRLLERQGIVPMPNWTPLEFSDQLSFLPPRAYHDIRRITELFYRIRYGQVQLNAQRRRRLANAITKIGRMMK